MATSLKAAVGEALRVVAERLRDCAGQKLVFDLDEAGRMVGRSPRWFLRLAATGRVQLCRRGRAVSRSELSRLVVEGVAREVRRPSRR